GAAVSPLAPAGGRGGEAPREAAARGGIALPPPPAFLGGGGVRPPIGGRCFTRDKFPAKQKNTPAPPVLLRSSWLQPPPGPREGCDEFHDFDASSSRRPWRSMWPSMTAPCALLV